MKHYEKGSKKDLGYDTVAVSSYGMCSQTFLPYQGRVYINDAFTSWSGETEPLEPIHVHIAKGKRHKGMDHSLWKVPCI